MALHDIWLTTPDQIRDKHVQQIIAFAGEGKLLDGGSASSEFRAFLGYVPSEFLKRYAAECLAGAFPNSGLALQDIVNEVGKRLGFTVTSGRYRGVPGQIGFDGMWTFPDGHAAIIEVKTTDAYRIDLDTIAKYRRSLIAENRVSESASSILIVVGRQDTGDLEAQIRGSRHAWDIRVISVDALLRLLALKEELEDPRTVRQIHNLLVPREFTRLDDIVELVFSTAEEVRQDEAPQDAPADEREPPSDTKLLPVSFHQECIARIESVLKTPLLRESRVTFLSPDRHLGVVCAVSREYERGTGAAGYWFAFHLHQKELLETLTTPYVAFGCGSPDQLLLIPFADFASWLDGMNTTERPERMYWHVHIVREGSTFVLTRRKGFSKIDLQRYRVH